MAKFSVQNAVSGSIVYGDPRGDGSTDLQFSRTASTEVASGYASLITGGARNTASGDFAVVIGGLNNTSSGEVLYVLVAVILLQFKFSCIRLSMSSNW